MSMNLYFETKDGVAMVDFPFQTPTDLTYAVIEEKDNTRRLELIKDAMISWEWDYDDIHEMLIRISEMLNSDHLQLTYM